MGAEVLLLACYKVMEVMGRPSGRKAQVDRLPGKVALVVEHRTRLIASSPAGLQTGRPQQGRWSSALLGSAWSQRSYRPKQGLVRGSQPPPSQPPCSQAARQARQPSASSAARLSRQPSPSRPPRQARAKARLRPVAPTRQPPQPPRRQAASQAAASEPGPSASPTAKRTKTEQATKPSPTTRAQAKAKARAGLSKPAPQPSRDCNAKQELNKMSVMEAKGAGQSCAGGLTS